MIYRKTLIMKELLQGIIIFISALIVSVFVFTLGTLYSLGYAIWLSITFKKWYAFFTFWWRLIDGFCASIGHILYEIGYGLDLGWNVNGEIIEDMVTAEEDTTFNQKNISVSATIGKLEIENKLNPAGKMFSKLLNKVFMQKRHAVDSWNFLVAKKALRDQYFNK